MNIPRADIARSGPVTVAGIPFDAGMQETRVGAREGPDAIRYASRFTGHYLATESYDVLDSLDVRDAGNLPVVTGSMDGTLAELQQPLSTLVASGTIPITLGGDGSISYPVIEALAGATSDFVILHFDAHTDAYPLAGNSRRPNATTFTRLVEALDFNPAHIMHLGVRGSLREAGTVSFARDQGSIVLTADDLMAIKSASVASELYSVIDGRPLYICWDMDVFDPAVAPGVATPVWGGLSAREGLGLIEAFKGHEICGVDINTVTPAYDVNGATASLAAEVAFRWLHVIADQRPRPGDAVRRRVSGEENAS